MRLTASLCRCPTKMAKKPLEIQVMEIGVKPSKPKIEPAPEEKKKKKKKKKSNLPPALEALPKKITKETALALVTPRKVSKLNTKGMRSILGDSAEEIQQLLEANNSDSAISLMQKRMAQTVVDLIPYAEHAVRKSKGARGVYQINSLVTSLREIMIDMQSTKDKGAIGDTMVEKVIRPAFLDIGMELVLEDERMLKEIKDEIDLQTYKKIRAIHAASLERIAKVVQTKYGEAKQGAISFMQH